MSAVNPDNHVALSFAIDLTKHRFEPMCVLMVFDDLTEFSSETGAGTIRVRIFDLENGLLILISDKERFRLGLSAMAIPPGRASSEPTSTGVFSVGIDISLVRTLSERIASWTNRTCMVVLGLAQINNQTMLELTSILRDHLLK